MKRIQNKVAESRRSLPIAILYGIVIWALAGLAQEQWWIQFCCFLLSIYLMAVLNHLNVLIRIFSRMVSVSYICLFSAAVFLFPSITGMIVQVCFIASLILLYACYQDKASPGHTFYAFLCMGIGSLADIRILYFVPVLWLLMATITYSLSWRTFFASLLGLLTPYWFWVAWMLWQQQAEFSALQEHLTGYYATQIQFDYTSFSFQQLLLLGFTFLLGVIGGIHFIRNSYQDKIRTRQIYYSFFIIELFALLFIFLMPECYDLFMRILIIAVSPLIAHFLALTSTKLTNIAFFIILGAVLILTVFNLWISSYPF